MTTLVKIHRKGQMTLPSLMRKAVGMAEGDFVELSVKQGQIIITPKLIIDRSHFPNADGEYTPAQRRAINKGISQSLKEYKQGKAFGPFETHKAFVASLNKQAAKLKTKK